MERQYPKKNGVSQS